MSIRNAKEDGWKEKGVPGIFNHLEALAPSMVCPVNKVTMSSPTIRASRMLLSLPICSYFTVPTNLVNAKAQQYKKSMLRKVAGGSSGIHNVF